MSVNDFYKCSEEVRHLLKFRDFDRLFGKMSSEARAVINTCITDMEKIASGTKIIGDTNRVHRMVDIVLDRVTREYISPYLHDFCEKCGLLLYNWNQSIENPSKSLATKLCAIDRLVKSHYTMLDAIRVLRNLTRRPYTPAAYELSRHYLRAIHNENKEINTKTIKDKSQ